MEEDKSKEIIRKYFSEIAKRRWAKTSPEERTAYAKKIAKLPRKKRNK